MIIHVAHSPDSDDAFMFYALASGKIDTEGLTYVHELQDIESLNQRALRGELEVTAVSIHAYAYLADRYALLPHGSSMGDKYGPRLVALEEYTRESIRGKRIAIPGPMTTATATPDRRRLALPGRRAGNRADDACSAGIAGGLRATTRWPAPDAGPRFDEPRRRRPAGTGD